MTAISFACIPLTKLAGRNIEFAADKFSGDLVGNEHMANAIQKIGAKITEIMDAGGIPKALQHTIKILDYHPSDAARIARLGR